MTRPRSRCCSRFSRSWPRSASLCLLCACSRLWLRVASSTSAPTAWSCLVARANAGAIAATRLISWRPTRTTTPRPQSNTVARPEGTVRDALSSPPGRPALRAATRRRGAPRGAAF
eukprot:Amastigsp_a510501_11.p3 type:complete len:116 gc:universal Amastigsp_a510501_11:567-914(+)